MLKVIQPFFKQRKKGEIVPIRISGTYEKPSFGLDMGDKKAQNVGCSTASPAGQEQEAALPVGQTDRALPPRAFRTPLWLA